MADDLDKAIRQIAQMFGGAQSSPNPADGSEESAMPDQTEPIPQGMQALNTGAIRDNLGILSKAQEMIDSFNHVSDSRINLLNSIHPFLSPARRSSCASCIQLLKIVAVISAITPGNQSRPRGE